MNFKTWINTFIEEKGIDINHTFEVEGREWGMNLIPVGSIIEFACGLDRASQQKIKATIVKIDFINGDVMHFLEYIAKGMAR